MSEVRTDQMEVFHKLFPHVREESVKKVFCPYRVCPLGAHVDHQHGLITGFALDKGVDLLFSVTHSGLIDVASMNFPGMAHFSLANIPARQGDWGDYVRAAATALRQNHRLDYGICGIIQGSLPIGGLSSSAAVILANLLALCKANNIELAQQELIDTALYAENIYVGLSVGKLDQSCEVLGRKDHLLFLDTKTEKYELIPQHPNLPQYEIAIFFSGIERALVGSAFNMRVDECKAAAYGLKGLEGLEYGKFIDTRLRDVPEDIFMKWKDRLPDPWARRANHFFGEFRRVQQGAQAWKTGDIRKFGDLIFQSGYSSINNYETGSPELIALYDIMLDTPGIYGGRFSGAGFKGCCMAIIDPKHRDSIRETVTKRYTDQFPNLKNAFSVHFCQSADGVSLFEMPGTCSGVRYEAVPAY